MHWLTHCYRGQAPSHIGFGLPLSQYHRASPGGRFLKRFMLHMYWLG